MSNRTLEQTINADAACQRTGIQSMRKNQLQKRITVEVESEIRASMAFEPQNVEHSLKISDKASTEDYDEVDLPIVLPNTDLPTIENVYEQLQPLHKTPSINDCDLQ